MPPTIEVAPFWKFAPLMSTAVPPAIGPEAGTIVARLGAAAGALITLEKTDPPAEPPHVAKRNMVERIKAIINPAFLAKKA